jgi:hypothetical protein
MWTSEDDLLFLKYCPSKRMKCFHMMARDTSCRPHELLKLRIKDVNFKISPDKYQYAELLVNGKTGSRPLVLIDSIPYLKDYLDHEHPQPGNQNAYFSLDIKRALEELLEYRHLKPYTEGTRKNYFPSY